MEDCLFCKIISGELPSTELYRDDEAVAFQNIHPDAPVHILIVPVKHIRSVAELEVADEQLVGKLIAVARDLAVKQGIDTDGYRIVINTRSHAGQEVDHLHVHLLGGQPLGHIVG